MSLRDSLRHEHTPKAINERLNSARSHSYLGDFVLGAIDGAVTTFAVVAGVAGAGYSASVAIVLGMANLLADGFSMAVGNYLSSKSEKQVIDRVRRMEARHIEVVPEGEREELRQIFANKGFEEPLLGQIVEVISQNRDQWIDTMITEEFGLQLETPTAWKAGLATFVAFLAAGFVPLAPFFLPIAWEASTMFIVSCAATGLTFFVVGYAKGYVVQMSRLISGLETLAIGGAAAGLAYLAGVVFQGFTGENVAQAVHRAADAVLAWMARIG